MKIIDNYLTNLHEQFNPAIRIASVKGEMSEDWVNCFEARCERYQVSYEKKFCKANCIITSTRRAVARLGALRGQCNKAQHPESCLNQLESTIKSLNKKIEDAREDQRDAREKAAEFRRKEAGGI